MGKQNQNVKTPSQDAAIESISFQLERIAKLLSLELVKGLKQAEQIMILDGAGYQPREIARMLGTTANSVRVAKSTGGSRKKKVKRK